MKRVARHPARLKAKPIKKMDEPFCRINDPLSEWDKLGFIASQSSDDMTLLGGNFLN